MSTRAEILEWLEGRTRTLGWDALISIDASVLNRGLAEHHVEQVIAGIELPPVNGEINGRSDPARVKGSESIYIYNMRLGPQRLSFTNTSIERSTALLVSDMLSGVMVFRAATSVGAGRVHKIETLSTQNAPQLVMELNLMQGVQNVADDGVIALDLDNAHRFSTSIIVDPALDSTVDRFFSQWLKGLNPEHRRFPLGSFIADSNDALAPRQFLMRTLAKDDLAQDIDDKRFSSQSQEGELLLMLTLRDGTPGFLPTPDSDLRSLIPSDGGAAYSFAGLLSHSVFMRRLLKPALQRQSPNGSFYFEDALDGAISLTGYFSIAVHPGLDYSGEYAGLPYRISSGKLPFTFPHRVKVVNAGLRFAYEGQIAFDFVYWLMSTAPMARAAIGGFKGHTARTLQLDAVRRSGIIVLGPAESFSDGLSAKSVDGAQGVQPSDLIGEGLKSAWHAQADPFIDQNCNHHFASLKLEVPATPVDYYKPTSGQSVTLTDVSLPADLAMFGYYDAPVDFTTIIPSHAQVISSGTLLLGTIPSFPATWALEGAGGESKLGRISPQGLYHAPELARYEHRRQVVAVLSWGQLRLNKLIDIVPAFISLSPVIQVCNAGQSQTVRASAIREGMAEWQVAPSEHPGALAPDKDNDAWRTYKAAPSVPGLDYVLDTIECSTSDSDSAATAQVLVIHSDPTNAIEVSPLQGASSIRLSFRLGSETLPPELVNWELVHGDGSVVNGLFAEAQGGRGPYGLIIATYETVSTGGIPLRFWDYCILPLPLATFFSDGPIGKTNDLDAHS